MPNRKGGWEETQVHRLDLLLVSCLPNHPTKTSSSTNWTWQCPCSLNKFFHFCGCVICAVVMETSLFRYHLACYYVIFAHFVLFILYRKATATSWAIEWSCKEPGKKYARKVSRSKEKECLKGSKKLGPKVCERSSSELWKCIQKQ